MSCWNYYEGVLVKLYQEINIKSHGKNEFYIYTLWRIIVGRILQQFLIAGAELHLCSVQTIQYSCGDRAEAPAPDSYIADM